MTPSNAALQVLVHGFTGSAESWRAVVQAMGPSIQVQQLSLPGHRVGAPVADSFADNVDWLADGAQRRPAKRRHLVGYSMGARLALGLLLRYPHLFARATLIGVHPGLRTVQERTERARNDARWADLLRERGIEAFVDVWEKQPLFHTQRAVAPERLLHQRRIRLAHDPGALARSLEVLGLANMPDFRHQLEGLEVPLRLLVGEHDAKFGKLAAEMAEMNDRVSCRSIPACGHNPLVECPERLAAIVMQEWVA